MAASSSIAAAVGAATTPSDLHGTTTWRSMECVTWNDAGESAATTNQSAGRLGRCRTNELSEATTVGRPFRTGADQAWPHWHLYHAWTCVLSSVGVTAVQQYSQLAIAARRSL